MDQDQDLTEELPPASPVSRLTALMKAVGDDVGLVR